MEINETHYAAYRAIKENGELTLMQLCILSGVEYDAPMENRYEANTKAYRRMWNVKEAINRSPLFDETIVIDKGMWRFATRDEAFAYDEWLESEIKKLGRRRSILRRKIRAHDQGKLLNNAGMPMRERDKEFHDAYRKV